MEKDSVYTVEYYLTDDRHSMDLVRTDENTPDQLTFGKYLKENSILVMKIRKKR